MCGVFAILDAPGQPGSAFRHGARASERLDRLAHRGPDSRGVVWTGHGWLGHRRLAIVDPDGGAQPLRHDGVTWAANGEIYNHEELRDAAEPWAATDSAVLGPGWRRACREDSGSGTSAQEAWLSTLRGPFAFIAVDAASGAWVAARDAMGISPLYQGVHRDGTLWFASEMKALVDDCRRVALVPPGHLVRDGLRAPRRWFRPDWLDAGFVPDEPVDEASLRNALVRAVERRLMSDVPLGLLCSGGLDSSLVASIATRIRRGGAPMHSFAIGLPGAPDLAPARRVADALGTDHHEFHFTVDEAMDALTSVVEHVESWEQVRTAVPTYLLAKRIRESGLGIKTVLSGEGADELFGGYLYFHRAPSDRAFFDETVRKVTRLHQFDVMRANKAPMAWGLELRFPFLDTEVVDLAMRMDPASKRCDLAVQPDGRHPQLEKYALRKAFDQPDEPWLPEEVLWRAKEQFSDGVGYSWVDRLRERATWEMARSEMGDRVASWGADAPASEELCWMRMLFEQRFVDGRAAGTTPCDTVPRGRSVACSTPEALAWDPEWETMSGDISGRAIRGVHQAADAFDLTAPAGGA